MSIFGTKVSPNRAICSKTKNFRHALRQLLGSLYRTEAFLLLDAGERLDLFLEEQPELAVGNTQCVGFVYWGFRGACEQDTEEEREKVKFIDLKTPESPYFYYY